MNKDDDYGLGKVQFEEDVIDERGEAPRERSEPDTHKTNYIGIGCMALAFVVVVTAFVSYGFKSIENRKAEKEHQEQVQQSVQEVEEGFTKEELDELSETYNIPDSAYDNVKEPAPAPIDVIPEDDPELTDTRLEEEFFETVPQEDQSLELGGPGYAPTEFDNLPTDSQPFFAEDVSNEDLALNTVYYFINDQGYKEGKIDNPLTVGEYIFRLPTQAKIVGDQLYINLANPASNQYAVIANVSFNDQLVAVSEPVTPYTLLETVTLNDIELPSGQYDLAVTLQVLDRYKTVVNEMTVNVTAYKFE